MLSEAELRKATYREWAYSDGIHLPLFMQPHWLDVVCTEGEWGVCLSKNKEGVIDAAMPYFLKRKYGIRYLTMPQLTPFLGIWFLPEDISERRLLSRRLRQVNTLIDQLPKIRWHQQRLHQSLTNWLPFYWAGYTEETRYTFCLEDCSDQDALLAGFSNGLKQKIKEAEKVLHVEKAAEANAAFQLFRDTLAQADVALSQTLLNRVDKALLEHDQRNLYLAFTHDRKLAAAIYIAKDKGTFYNLLNGRNRALDILGATDLLLWEAIKDAGAAGRSFDFEGSMLPGVHEFFRSFGGVLTPQSIVRKYNGWARLLKVLR